MFERFTDRARRTVVLAQEEAQLLSHDYIGTEHILLGLIRERDGVAAKALESLGIGLDRVRGEVETMIGRGSGTPIGHVPFTPRAKRVLELSLREALELGHDYIGTEHVLLGLIREGEGVAAQVLVKTGGGLQATRTKILDLLSSHGLESPEGKPLPRASDRTLSPGLEAAIALAGDLAGDGPIGTHHLLAVMATNEELAAYSILADGGFELSTLERSPEEWDIAGTLDETPELAAARATTIENEGDSLVVRLTDVELVTRIREALDTGELSADRMRAEFGRLWRTLDRLGQGTVEAVSVTASATARASTERRGAEPTGDAAEEEEPDDESE